MDILQEIDLCKKKYKDTSLDRGLIFSKKQAINPFLADNPILYPRKHRKTKVFWCFQVGKKWEHWPEMGLYEPKRSRQIRVQRYITSM